jgi:beta-galactosidase
MKATKFNDGWRFWQDKNSFALIWTTPDDAREITLPHDAMIEGKRNPQSKNAGNSGFFDGGTYFYTRNLHVDESVRDQTLQLRFDGVYKNALVFVNGQLAGKNIYGYSTFYVPLNDYLHYGADNEIRVQVKTGAEPNSRWYSGSGIYRDVYLLSSGKTYLRPDGVQIKTVDCDKRLASLEVNAEIRNDDEKCDCVLYSEIRDREGNVVAQDEAPLSLFANEVRMMSRRLYVKDPMLWDDEHPALYDVVLTLKRGDEVLDEHRTTTGIRKLSLNPVDGLKVNGRQVKLRGACIHHDSGLLGAVTLKKNSYRELALLKRAGFNAIRMSHQPAAPTLLDACDELGMYVLDETFDMWRRSKSDYDYSLVFDECWKQDVQAMVRKDFNHPSVILYSIGNEIPEIGTDQGLRLCSQIDREIKAFDDTRYTLAAVNGMYTVGNDIMDVVAEVASSQESRDIKNLNINEFMMYQDKYLDQIVKHPAISERLNAVDSQLDILGYNYMSARYHDDVKAYPNRIIVGSETYPPKIARDWQDIEQLPQVIGDFTWTGWDYLGEAGVGVPSYQFGVGGFGSQYPALTSYVADIDLTGFRRPTSYYREIVFGRRKAPYIAVQNPHHYGESVMLTPWIVSDCISSWSWDVPEGSKCVVEVYSPGTSVELLLNGKSLGRKPAGSDVGYRTLFETQYEPGQLKAVAYEGEEVLGEMLLASAGPEVGFALEPETEFNAMDCGDSHNLEYVDVVLHDKDGNVVTDHDVTFTVSLEGDGDIYAVGSADHSATLPFTGRQGKTFHGRALVIVERGVTHQASMLRIEGENGLSGSLNW